MSDNNDLALGDELPVIVAMTGASGAVYAVRLIQALLGARTPVHVTMSSSAASVIQHELDVTPKLDGSNLAELFSAANRFLEVSDDETQHAVNRAVQAVQDQSLVFHHFKDYFTPIASGSFLTRGMVVCPCSGSTLSGIAHASSNNLIQRAADVHLKERRKLIVVPRETPLNTFQLENMHRLSQHGVVVLPASPGWYHGIQRLHDLVDFVVARILDQLHIDNQLMTRWSQEDEQA